MGKVRVQDIERKIERLGRERERRDRGKGMESESVQEREK